jgi:hypothetical protein
MKDAADKNIRKKYFCIDTFKSSNVELNDDETFLDFVKNMQKVNLSYNQFSEPGSMFQLSRSWYSTDYKDNSVMLEIVDDFSYNVVKEVPDNLDWIYIDGSHETKDVLQDIELYAPKVKNGGMLLFHDHTWPSVRVAVDIAVSKNIIKLVEYFDDFGIYQKM